MSEKKITIPSECYEIAKGTCSSSVMETYSEKRVEETYFKMFSVTVSWMNRSKETYTIESQNESMALMETVRANSYCPNEMYDLNKSKVEIA